MLKVEIKNKSAVTLHGLKSGNKMKIAVDDKGTPLDLNWRRRVNDSRIDGCIEIVESKMEKEE